MEARVEARVESDWFVVFCFSWGLVFALVDVPVQKQQGWLERQGQLELKGLGRQGVGWQKLELQGLEWLGMKGLEWLELKGQGLEWPEGFGRQRKRRIDG